MPDPDQNDPPDDQNDDAADPPEDENEDGAEDEGADTQTDSEKRLAKALIPWLHKTDPVTRLGSDRSPAMARQCDFALWIAHQISAGVTLPVNYLDNYSAASFAAAKTVLQELPALPLQ